jgi:mannose-6-phosphate isomerase-like protein (cupin superfamily)
MPVIAATDAPVFELPGLRFTGLAAPSRGACDNAVWVVTVAPGAEAVHHQMTREETFVAIEGRARAIVGGREHRLGPGSALVVPSHTDFALDNPYDLPFRAVVVLPVGGQAIIGSDPAFTPPWAE